MTKAQALQSFWELTSVPAYEENSVPDEAPNRYVTYEVQFDSFDHSVYLTATLWDKSTSWVWLNGMAVTMSERLTGGYSVLCDGGAMTIRKADPFARHTADEKNDLTKGVIFNIEVEFETLY